MTDQEITQLVVATDAFDAPEAGRGEATTSQPFKALTTCETEFLKRLVRGDTYREIAIGMNVSINTVRDYVRAVYRKLQVNSRTQAVVKYLREQPEPA